VIFRQEKTLKYFRSGYNRSLICIEERNVYPSSFYDQVSSGLFGFGKRCTGLGYEVYNKTL